MYYTYAVGLKFIADREGSAHNVLHSPNYYVHKLYMIGAILYYGLAVASPYVGMARFQGLTNTSV